MRRFAINKKDQEKDYVIINGLKWDKENILVPSGLSTNAHTEDGNSYFRHVYGNEWAQNNFKRCPTPEEYADLIKIGSTWDENRVGRWFGYDHEKKSNSFHSIFFPAVGYYHQSTMYFIGQGYYLTDFIEQAYQTQILSFDQDKANISISVSIPYHSLRCVQDL